MCTISHTTDPLLIAAASNSAALLALSDERDMHDRRVLAAEQRGFDRGHAAGYALGRADEYASWALSWRLMIDLINPRRYHLSYARLETTRYGPPGWGGTVPHGLSPLRRRLWLARLPRTGDRQPQP